MKFLKCICFFLFLFFIFSTANASSKYTSKTLKEACQEEGITCSFQEYPYDEEKPTIYIFRKTGCGYCKQMMSYISSLMDEYGGDINVVTYEASENQNNMPLARQAASKLGETIEGFPYTIIGSKSFEGYLPSYNESIVEAIEGVITLQDKTDVVKTILEKGNQNVSGNRETVVIFLVGVIAVGSLFLGSLVMKKN